MDLPTVKLLLDCLEIAMKRNGDIKLAAMHAQPKAMLELTGVDRLFEFFDTTADAARSFRRLSSLQPCRFLFQLAHYTNPLKTRPERTLHKVIRSHMR